MRKFLLQCLLLFILVLTFIFYGYTENRSLDVDHLTIKVPELPENLSGLTIVHLSDIHFPNNRIATERLIAETKKAQPNFIFLTGDLIHRTADIDETPLAALVSALTDIAPTYSVSGNHEVSSDQLAEWNTIMIQNNVILLEDEVDHTIIAGEDIAIAGLEDWHMTTEIQTSSADSALTLLLAHRPEYFESYATAHPQLQPDLTFSGHAHGGQIRLPFIGGLFAPGQGFFPKYTSGVYADEQISHQQLVVSRGIGNSLFPLRINNKPHFIIVTLTSS